MMSGLAEAKMERNLESTTPPLTGVLDRRTVSTSSKSLPRPKVSLRTIQSSTVTKRNDLRR